MKSVGLAGVVACVFGLWHGHAAAQTPDADSPQLACANEHARPLAVTAVEAVAERQLQTICPTGTIERIQLTAAVGAASNLQVSFEQNEFGNAIYHIDVRDAAQRPINWIKVSPAAGEISTVAATLELSITPPVELMASVQTVTLKFRLHDGSQSWTRDIELQITVDEEQPLFRDQFEIDPVIGQFSQRTPARRAASFATAAQGSSD